jgi:hypothetical protein
MHIKNNKIHWLEVLIFWSKTCFIIFMMYYFAIFYVSLVISVKKVSLECSSISSREDSSNFKLSQWSYLYF